MAHKAETRDFHWSLSIATFSSYFHVFPAVFISASIVLLQVSRGRPLFLLPLSGVHLNVVRVMLSRSFLIICPSHLHLLCIITVVMFRWPVLWYSSLFVIFWGQYILQIFLRQLQSVFVNSSLFLSYNRLKLNLRVFLSRSYCCYGNLLCHENNTNVFTSDWAVFWYHDCSINR